MFITDARWEEVKSILEPEKPSILGCPGRNLRKVFEAVLYVLHTGIQWKCLPGGFPTRKKTTVYNYLKQGCQQDRFQALFAGLDRGSTVLVSLAPVCGNLLLICGMAFG